MSMISKGVSAMAASVVLAFTDVILGTCKSNRNWYIVALCATLPDVSCGVIDRLYIPLCVNETKRATN